MHLCGCIVCVCVFSACVCGATTITNAPPPTTTSTSLLPTGGMCPQPSLSHAKADLKSGHIYLPSPAPSSSSSSLLFKWLPRSCSAFHSWSSMFAARWMDGWMERTRWWWRRRRKRRRRREAFEVRKSGSPLTAQLRGLDSCRFQGSVRRPDGRQAAACRKETTLPVSASRIKVTIGFKLNPSIGLFCNT